MSDTTPPRAISNVPNWWPVIVAILTVAVTYGTYSQRQADAERRLDRLEAGVQKLDDIDERLSEIEGKLGIERHR
jgi:hypothetical protein